MTTVISGTSGITFPAGGTGNPAGTVVGTTDSQTLTNKTIGSGYSGSTVTQGTQVASTSGTSISFTGIPSWVKRITVLFNGVSLSSTSNFLFQIGSGSTDTSGYLSRSVATGSAANVVGNSTAGIVLVSGDAGNLFYGAINIYNISGNTWIFSGTFAATQGTSTFAIMTGGNHATSAALDRVVITTVSGTDTFDAGAINIQYE